MRRAIFFLAFLHYSFLLNARCLKYICNGRQGRNHSLERERKKAENEIRTKHKTIGTQRCCCSFWSGHHITTHTHTNKKYTVLASATCYHYIVSKNPSKWAACSSCRFICHGMKCHNVCRKWTLIYVMLFVFHSLVRLFHCLSVSQRATFLLPSLKHFSCACFACTQKAQQQTNNKR